MLCAIVISFSCTAANFRRYIEVISQCDGDGVFRLQAGACVYCTCADSLEAVCLKYEFRTIFVDASRRKLSQLSNGEKNLSTTDNEALLLDHPVGLNQYSKQYDYGYGVRFCDRKARLSVVY